MQTAAQHCAMLIHQIRAMAREIGEYDGDVHGMVGLVNALYARLNRIGGLEPDHRGANAIVIGP